MLNNPWILGGGPMTHVGHIGNQIDGSGGSGGSGHMVVQTQSVSIASSDGSVIHQTNTYESWVTVTGPQPMNLDIVSNTCPGQNLYSSVDMGPASTITSRAPDAYLTLPMHAEALPVAPSVAVSMQTPFVTHNQVEPVVAVPTQMAVADTPLVNAAETFIAVPVPPTCDPLVAMPAVQNMFGSLVGTSEASVPMIQTTTPQTTQTNMPSWYLVVQDLPDSMPTVNGVAGSPSVVRTDDDLFLCTRCNSTFEKVTCINWHLRECKGVGGDDAKSNIASANGTLSSNTIQVKTLHCTLCARLFTVLHEPSSSFVCSDCSTSTVPFVFPSVIQSVGQFKCSECGDCFSLDSDLEDHQTSHRSTVTICELPDNFVEENGNDEDVSIIVEPTVEVPEDSDESASVVSEETDDIEPEQNCFEICGECGGSFNCTESLSEHVKSHGSIRSYGCTKCGLICDGKYSLNRHVWAHGRESEDKENIVDSYYGDQVGNAKDGVVAQPFGCTECGMQFSDSNDLKEHCVSHLRSKPFLCTRCGEKFETTSSLEKHWEGHALVLE